jgi:hypothetical protein
MLSPAPQAISECVCGGVCVCTIHPVEEWGDAVRAVFDVHRLELYDKLGVRRPASPEEEQEIGRAVTRCLLYAEPIAARFRTRPPDEKPEQEAT